MYNIGDMVLYGGEGLCRISGIEDKKIADRTIKYYALTPARNESSVFYVPTEGKAAETKLRKIVSGKEIKKIIKEADCALWEDNDRQRRDIYSGAINSADRGGIASLIKACDKHKKEIFELGKKLHKVDEYFLAEAEKLLYGEFKTVLKIEKEEIIPFVLGEFEPEEL
ncbi:MAG: hypothetical protein IKL74_05825 [Clostridia bacterium]|nr:hypothetical protein [Clostridia bacterium]